MGIILSSNRLGVWNRKISSINNTYFCTNGTCIFDGNLEDEEHFVNCEAYQVQKTNFFNKLVDRHINTNMDLINEFINDKKMHTLLFSERHHLERMGIQMDKNEFK